MFRMVISLVELTPFSLGNEFLYLWWFSGRFFVFLSSMDISFNQIIVLPFLGDQIIFPVKSVSLLNYLD